MSKILIADDNTMNRQLGAMLLERAEQRVVEAANGEEAVAVAQAEQPDLILMDLNMPVMDGIDALHRLREIEATRHIPILAITGYPERWGRQMVLEWGFQGYLEKPFRPDTFADDVLAHLQPVLTPVRSIHAHP